MKTLALSLLLLCATAPTTAHSFDFNLTAEEISLEGLYFALHIVDWGQTLDIENNPDKYYEMNYLMGRHPSRGRVNLVMGVHALLHPMITMLLPRELDVLGYQINPRRWYQTGTVALKVGYVSNNFNIGLSVAF